MLNKIINPLNNKSYNINSKEGKILLLSYINNFYGSSNGVDELVKNILEQLKLQNIKYHNRPQSKHPLGWETYQDNTEIVNYISYNIESIKNTLSKNPDKSLFYLEHPNKKFAFEINLKLFIYLIEVLNIKKKGIIKLLGNNRNKNNFLKNKINNKFLFNKNKFQLFKKKIEDKSILQKKDI